MEIGQLINALADPAAYPYSVERVEVKQTHISVVFLAGSLVFKIKKPVNPGFLDFRTLEQRRHFCEEEVRLNRRLAPRVYLGVVPIAETPVGLRVDGAGVPVEWAVKMVRLPDSATLLQRLLERDVDRALVQSLARRIADFHLRAVPAPAGFGGFEATAKSILEIFDKAATRVGTTVSAAVFAKTKDLTEQALASQRNLIDGRAARGMIRDCHGDLHLDHIYLFPNRPDPEDLVIIDCIEFNDQFRNIDPVADIAFPAMDFAFYGRRDLARLFAASYFAASGDEEGRSLLPLFVAYRATIRGLVDGLLLAETEATAEDRARALQRARAHWLLALASLSPPIQRPCLVLIAGLPGSGKSTLARELAARAAFQVIRSDVVRKEAAVSTQEDRYAPASIRRTYEECRARAEALLFEGQRIIIDATFREESMRLAMIETARQWGVSICFLVCQASSATTRARLAQRKGDASDADWSTYLYLAEQWEPFGPESSDLVHLIDTDADGDHAVVRALEVLQDLELFGGSS